MPFILGLGSLDLTYRAAVLAFLDVETANGSPEPDPAGEHGPDLELWLEHARAQGADGVWLEGTTANPGIFDRVAAAFEVVAANRSVMGDAAGQAWPVVEAAVLRDGTGLDSAGLNDTQIYRDRVFEAGLFSPRQSVVDRPGGDPDRSVGEQLWQLHQLVGEGQIVLLMPPPSDRAPIVGHQVEASAVSGARSSDPKSAPVAGIWSLAVAQGVRVVVAKDVGVARRTVDSVAEMLAGEQGPAIVTFD